MRKNEAIIRNSSRAGYFALSYNINGKVKNTLIQYNPDTDNSWKIGKVTYSSIEEIKDNLKERFNLDLLELPWGNHVNSNKGDRRWSLDYEIVSFDN